MAFVVAKDGQSTLLLSSDVECFRHENSLRCVNAHRMSIVARETISVQALRALSDGQDTIPILESTAT